MADYASSFNPIARVLVFVQSGRRQFTFLFVINDATNCLVNALSCE